MNDCQSISPYVRLVHDFLSPPDLTMPACWINDHALHYIKDGNGTYRIRGNRYAIERGVVFVVRPDDEFSFAASPGQKLHMLNVHFDTIERADSRGMDWPYPRHNEQRTFLPNERLEFDSEDNECLPSRMTLPDCAEFEALFHNLRRLHGLSGKAGALRVKSAMLDLLAYLFQSIRQAHERGAPHRHEQVIQATMRYIQDNYWRPVTLNEIADAASLSATHLTMLYKAYTGRSPIQSVIHLRMERAKIELSFTTTPIKQVALAVGYESVHHFSRVFKRSTGFSPAHYRTVYSPRAA